MTDMLTAKELQDLLQVDRSTIYRMADAGKLPAIKVGRQWRFPADQVHAWLMEEAQWSDRAPAPRPVAVKPVDVLPVSCIQPLTDLAADMLGVMMVVTDMDGFPLTEVSNPCGLFASVIDTPLAIQRCIESWHDLAATIDLEPRFGRSHLGLLCARGLVRTGSALIGMVFVGGIAPDDWPPAPADLPQLAKEFGVDVATVEARIRDVHILEPQERSRVLSHVQQVANVISHLVTERSELVAQLEIAGVLPRTPRS